MDIKDNHASAKVRTPEQVSGIAAHAHALHVHMHTHTHTHMHMHMHTHTHTHMHTHMHMHGQVAALARSSSPRRPGQRAPLPIKTHHGHVLVGGMLRCPPTLGTSPWATLGRARPQHVRRLGARLAALGGATLLPGYAAGRPATSSGARASRLQSQRCHSLWPFRCGLLCSRQ